MTNRSSIFLGVCVVLASIIFALGSDRPGVAQQPAGVPAQTYVRQGRFQIWPVNNAIVLWDTESGQTWTHAVNAANRWTDLNTPVPPAKILRGY